MPAAQVLVPGPDAARSGPYTALYVTNSLEADYVIWLDDAGVEAISFAPLSQQTGWARYFRESGTWGGVLVRFGFRRLPVLSAGAKAPIWVKEMAATVTGDHDPLLSVAGDVPMAKFEAAVNEPRHYDGAERDPDPEGRRTGQTVQTRGARHWPSPSSTPNSRAGAGRPVQYRAVGGWRRGPVLRPRVARAPAREAPCEGLAWVAGEAEDVDPEDVDPDAVLDSVLEAMRTLISRNAVYLDVATTPRSESSNSEKPAATD